MRINEQNYVDTAERVIVDLKGKKDARKNPIPMVTTSKIRNLLAMTSDIYNEVLDLTEDTLPQEICGRIEYLRLRCAYEAGREPSVRNLVQEAEILNYITEIRGSRNNFILFSRYMEALVAYHRYYGGKDA